MKIMSMMKIMVITGGLCTSQGTMVVASFTGISLITTGHHYHHICGRDDDGDHHRHHHHQINLNYQVASCEHLKAWLPSAAYEHDFTQVFFFFFMISLRYLSTIRKLSSQLSILSTWVNTDLFEVQMIKLLHSYFRAHQMMRIAHEDNMSFCPYLTCVYIWQICFCIFCIFCIC